MSGTISRMQFLRGMLAACLAGAAVFIPGAGAYALLFGRQEDAYGKEGLREDDPAAPHAAEREADFYQDGIYFGTGQDAGGSIEVEVVVRNGRVVSVTGDRGRFSVPCAGRTEMRQGGDREPSPVPIPDRMEIGQTVELNTLIFATDTLRGLKKAAEDALRQAV